MNETLPPGPRMPAILQTLGNWKRPTPFLRRARQRYGSPFTMRLIGAPTFVVIADPEQIKEIFQAPVDVLHPGEGASILEPVVGPNSVILLDEAPHLEQRKLLLPAFHGERMQRLAGLMAELAEAEVGSWPRDQADRASPAAAAPHAGGDPAGRLRARSGGETGSAARAADGAALVRRQPALAAACTPSR